jgi:hypothetical protein
MIYKQKIKILIGLALVDQKVGSSDWTPAHDKLLNDTKQPFEGAGGVLEQLLLGEMDLSRLEPETHIYSLLAVSLAEVGEGWVLEYDCYVDYVCSKSGFSKDDARDNLIIILSEFQERKAKPKFNHAYDIGFEIISENEQASDVTGVMLRASLKARIDSLSDKELLLTCNCFDTHEEEV